MLYRVFSDSFTDIILYYVIVLWMFLFRKRIVEVLFSFEIIYNIYNARVQYSISLYFHCVSLHYDQYIIILHTIITLHYQSVFIKKLKNLVFMNTVLKNLVCEKLSNC